MTFPTTRKHLLTLSTAVCLGLGLGLSAQEGEESEEFLSEEGLNHLEFRSVVTIGNETQYSLHDTESGTSFWVSEHEVRNGIEIVHFDSDDNSLTIYFGDEIHELDLRPSRVADLVEPSANANRGRPTREERRQRFRDFESNWARATQNSAQLNELTQNLRALATDFRETRSARREAERGTDERNNLLRQERAVSREIRLMSEYAALQASRDPAFQGDLSVNQMTSMVRSSAFRNRND